jgi:3-methylfumaryl-CoA hydratase
VSVDVFDRIVESWEPPELTAQDELDAEPSTAFAALLDQQSPVMETGDPLPPLWHWFHFPEWPAQGELGEDGHLADGAFLPPLPQRRRMFGGGRLIVHAPLRCGDTVRRSTKVSAVRTAQGRTGKLLLVTTTAEFSVNGEPRLVEQQDIVYRMADDVVASAPTAHVEPPVDVPGPWLLTVSPTPVLLFRFSGLTNNAHRIHYDREYAAFEGHPGLVVHGPLLALLMLELPRRLEPLRRVERFSWRAKRPLFDATPVEARGGPDGRLVAGTSTYPPAVTGRYE